MTNGILDKSKECFDKPVLSVAEGLSMRGEFLAEFFISPFVLSLSKDSERAFHCSARAKSFARICVWILICSLGGCVSLERAYPDRRYFVIESPRGVASPNSNAAGVLLVTSLRVSPRYESKSFIYRRSDAGFEADYYNQFLVSPGAMLTEDVRRGLAEAQAAQYIVGTSSQLDPTHALEGTVDAFYGDFRDTSAPKAVLEMEFFLSKESPAKAEILMHKRYAKAIPLKHWSKAGIKLWAKSSRRWRRT
jgi:cholesterol transport system auxiliary component